MKISKMNPLEEILGSCIKVASIDRKGSYQRRVHVAQTKFQVAQDEDR
jgi:hypothetical protein